MALILTQTDTVAPCGTILACTSPADGLAVTPQARKAEDGGSAGSGELSVTINKGDIQAGVMFESPAVGQTTWQSGTYTVRINITTSVADLLLTEVHVCRVNSSCVNQATVGSTTGLSISIGSTGVKTVEVTGAQQSASGTDRIYIVLIFQQTSHANGVFGFTPDQDIDTPIEEATEFVYDGDIPMSLVPATPKGIMDIIYGGAIPLSALPDFPEAILEKSYAGAIGLALLPDSTYGLFVEYVYAGDIAMTILPSYASILDRVYAGAMALSALPSYTSIMEMLYSGDIPLSIIPDFPVAPLEKSYAGAIGLILTPNSLYELSANEFVYSGDIALVLLPSYTSLVDAVYAGAIPVSLTPGYSSILDRVYAGNLPLSALPSYISALEKFYNGAIVLVLTPESAYMLESPVTEHVYAGNIPLSLLSGYLSVLEMPYAGDLGLVFMPTSLFEGMPTAIGSQVSREEGALLLIGKKEPVFISKK